MIEVKIQDKWYKLPTEYNDLTIVKYQNYIEIVENKQHFKTDIEFISNVIATLIDIDINILLKQKVSDLDIIKRGLSFLNEDVKFKLDEEDNKGMLEIDGVKYMFNKNMNNLTMGEYIDLDVLTKEPIKNLHKLMAIMYRPIKDQNWFEKKIGKYELIDYDMEYIESISEKFKNITITDVTKCLSFFLHFQVLYTEATKIYLDQVLAKMEKKKEKKLKKKIEPKLQ